MAGVTKMHDIDRLSRALQHYITCYNAIPNYPENAEVRARYLRGYEECLRELKELLND